MSKSRVKGTTWENRVRNYINVRAGKSAEVIRIEDGALVERCDFSSPLGDVRGLPCIIEAKATNHVSLSDWVKQARRSLGKTAWTMFGVFYRKRNCGVSEGYFISTIANGVTLLFCYDYMHREHPEMLRELEGTADTVESDLELQEAA